MEPEELGYQLLALCEPTPRQAVPVLDNDSPAARLQLIVDVILDKIAVMEVASTIEAKVLL
jgi:hypothetical protein